MLFLGELSGLAVGPDVEADDRGVGRRRELDVVLGDPAHTAVHEADLDLVALELAQALGDRFERAVDVGLHHQVEGRRLALLDLLEDVLELRPARQGVGLAAETGSGAASARGCRRPGLATFSRGGDHELVAGDRHVGLRPSTCTGVDGPASSTLIAVVVDQGPDPTPRRAPATMGSPTFSVPRCTSTVATAPRPMSRLDSSTTPVRPSRG